jgi:hypothetical protein
MPSSKRGRIRDSSITIPVEGPAPNCPAFPTLEVVTRPFGMSASMMRASCSILKDFFESLAGVGSTTRPNSHQGTHLRKMGPHRPEPAARWRDLSRGGRVALRLDEIAPCLMVRSRTLRANPGNSEPTRAMRYCDLTFGSMIAFMPALMPRRLNAPRCISKAYIAGPSLGTPVSSSAFIGFVDTILPLFAM